MTLADPKPGGWASHEVLTSTQMNAIRTELLKAIDGAGGGSYSLSAPLIFGGDTLRVDDELQINAGATLNVDGVSDFSDPATFSDDVNLNGDVVFGAAGTVTFTGGNDVLFGSLTDLAVNNLQIIYRLPLIPLGVALIADIPSWQTGTVAGGALYINTDASSLAVIYFVVPVMAGDVIENIACVVEGGAGSGHGGTDPTNKLRVRFMETPNLSGVPVSLASVEDPATMAAYDAVHTLQIDNSSTGGVFPFTVLNRVYLLEFRSENGGTAADGENRIHAINVVVNRNQLVSTNIFGA